MVLKSYEFEIPYERRMPEERKEEIERGRRAAREMDEEIGGVTGAAIDKGISSVASGYLNFIKMTDGILINPYSLTGIIYNKKMKGFVEAAAEKASRWDLENGEELDKAISEFDSSFGRGAARLYASGVTMVTEMIPTIVITLLSGGAGGAASGAAKVTGIVNKGINIVKGLLKKPMFWDSYARGAGNNYARALDDGATETEAQAAGHITGFLNAMVEHTGGVEPMLKGNLDADLLQNLITAWKKTAPEEAFEEAVQDNITSLVKKFTYRNDSEWFSFDNDEAVINPARTIEAAKEGYLFGGAFGTGNALVKSVRADVKNAPDADRKRYVREEEQESKKTVEKQKTSLTRTAWDSTMKVVSLSRYVNTSDTLHEYSGKIKLLEGFEDVVIHGDKYGFEIRALDGKTSEAYTAREFADILKEDPNYKGGNIRLISCETGADGALAAQMLANQLGVSVMAPTDIVWVLPDGEMIVGPNEFENTGEWKIFVPQKGE